MFSIVYNIPKFFEVEAVLILKQPTTEPLAEEEEEHTNTTSYVSMLSATTDSYLTMSKNRTTSYISAANETQRKLTNSVSTKSGVVLLSGYRMAPTSLMLNLQYYQIYLVWLNFIFNGLIPFLVLIVLNLLMLKKLKTQTYSGVEISRNDICLSMTSDSSRYPRTAQGNVMFYFYIYFESSLHILFIFKIRQQ